MAIPSQMLSMAEEIDKHPGIVYLICLARKFDIKTTLPKNESLF